MFGGYAEGMAYASNLDEDNGLTPSMIENEKHLDILCADVIPATDLFGGFETWPESSNDFILIAECSEICGPVPICTIPPTLNISADLNLLTVLILSADYQEFSSNKTVPASNARIMMPDIIPNVHVLVNHFVIYDSEARGFTRSLCVAYVSSDKYKLITLDEEIFSCLTYVVSLIQYSNKKFSVKGLDDLVEDLKLTKSNLTSNGILNISQTSEVYDQLIKSSLKDIQDILECINSPEALQNADGIIDDFIKKIAENIDSGNKMDFLFETKSETNDIKRPKVLQLPLQQDFNKTLRNLLIVSPGGALVSLYYLHLTHKYFRRKLEDIICESSDNEEDSTLCFGACLKLNSWVKGQNQDHCDNDFYVSPLSPMSNVNRDNYRLAIDVEFFDIVLELLQSISNGELDFKSFSILPSAKDIDHLPCASPKCSLRHVVTLSRIWPILEHLNSEIPGLESSVLKFFQSFQWTEELLYSLLTLRPIVIYYSLNDEFLVSNIIKFLAVITPRTKSQHLVVEHNREFALRKEELNTLVITTVSTQHKATDIISSNLLPFISVFFINDEPSYQGPKYKGCLLNGINVKIKAISPNQPFFPLLISIFAEIEIEVKFHQSISSVDVSCYQSVMESKCFSKCDINILKVLSHTCFTSEI